MKKTLYDIWPKMNVQWFAQRIVEREWYIFVHRPAAVRAYETKPAEGAEVGNIPEVAALASTCPVES